MNISEDYVSPNYTQNSGDRKYVQFFPKMKDGETLIVRFFPYKSTGEVVEKTVHHSYKLGEKMFKDIECLRTPDMPADDCPLCKSGSKMSIRGFIKMLYYVDHNDGNPYEAVATVWNCPRRFVQQLRGLMVEWGDISKMVFKLTRHGSDVNTTYDLIPANTNFYTEQLCPIDFSAFNGFNLSPYHCLEASREEMSDWVNSGIMFPQLVKKAKVEEVESQPEYNVQSTQPQVNQQVLSQPQPGVQPTPQVAPQQATQNVEEPIRRRYEI